MQLLLTTKRHFTIALWMPVRLSATTAASLNGCCGPWWDVSRFALNLMEEILRTYHKCKSFSYNSQIKCFRIHVDIDIFSCFRMRNSCPNCVRTFQLHPVYMRGWLVFGFIKKTTNYGIKKVFTLHIPPWAPHTYDFVVLTSLTHTRKIIFVVLQIEK
jgi:hypothetical protein